MRRSYRKGLSSRNTVPDENSNSETTKTLWLRDFERLLQIGLCHHRSFQMKSEDGHRRVSIHDQTIRRNSSSPTIENLSRHGRVAFQSDE
mmetsp:Transcript_4539/g.9073  ORF Transcript_4539/g.9073 Transcript_4539/m.9073 type:complete len:90 (-) Transcript_4539:10-279(-)